jgi:protein-disulfide isomerase
MGGSQGRIVSRVTPWAIATALVVLAVVLLYFFTGATATEKSRAAPVTSADIAFRPADAKLTVIEYSDFQCPYCAQYARWLERLREKYVGRVRFVYRFYPLPGHTWATTAAKVAYAAYLQGKFWQMHDLLYQKQPEWETTADPRPLFDSYARGLGLDMRQFRDDADSPSTAGFIERQAVEGRTAGVDGTPWFVVGDRSVLPRSLEQFDKVIRESL